MPAPFFAAHQTLRAQDHGDDENEGRNDIAQRGDISCQLSIAKNEQCDHANEQE